MLRRAAFSPNIKERADCSAALFTADGELLVQAEHIPVHLGSMPASVRGRHRRVRRPRSARASRSSLNDPFAGGTHLNDITLVAPCFVDGRLVGWAANRAHHADVGGAAPGSIPADATEIQQEGLRIPPTLLDDGAAAPAAGQLAHARRAGRRPRRPGRRQRGRRRAPGRARRTPRSPRSSTTASAGCGPRWPRCPTAPGGSSDVLDSTGAGRRPAAPGPRSRVARHGGRRRGRPSTSPAPTRRPAATSTRSRRSRCRRWPSPCGRPSTRRSRPTAARMRPVRVVAPAGHDRGGPAAGRGRRRQRRGEPAGRRRVPRARWPSRAPTGCRPPARGR